MISLLSQEDKKEECIRHAVDLSRAWLIGNYDRVMKLYKTAPKMSSYLMDLFINRERVGYFRVMMKAYVQTFWSSLSFFFSYRQVDNVVPTSLENLQLNSIHDLSLEKSLVLILSR